MNQEQARKLIRETFQNDFSKERFIPFIKEFLTGFDDSKNFPPRTDTNIRAAFRDRIASYERVGQYVDGNNKIVDVLVINLNCQTTLERGRTGLRNFIADYLTNTDQGAGKAAVLAAYVSPERSDWRFSFITLETELEQNEKGKFKEQIASITPARRKSFLVGKYEKTHTAQTRFLKWIEGAGNPTLADIEACFDVESVTKEFFQKYKHLFEETRKELLKICAQDKNIEREFLSKGMFTLREEKGEKIKEVNVDDFAKKLLGQIVFLYFLQKKGWFGVARGAEWGTGDKSFLRNLLNDKRADENFFNDVLEYLFYDALAVNRKGNGDFYGKLNCKIPFLNGGLFEPISAYDWVHTDIFLPDSLFSNRRNAMDEGSGILDVFDLYNFTINEAEPLETEVAVDPEMLGKIFENLLPENIRHDSGTYYTPRVIVAYMCQQSLVNYLATHLPNVPREDLETLIRFGAQAADYTEGGAATNVALSLPASIVENAELIDRLLQKITVCDPAIGSGAFPVGMMQEIVKAREALQIIETLPRQTQYELKRQTIENSLYGVDIDPGAVEIAKLRLWLSLIVDEADFHSIEPLPNLDYKIMQGNSLLDEFHGVKLIDEKMFEQKALLREVKLAEINREISTLQAELSRANVGRQSSMYVLTERRISELKKEKMLLADGTINLQFGLYTDEKDEAQIKLDYLKAKIKQFFGTADRDKKDRLRTEIENLEWEFIEAKLRADGKTDELTKLAEANKERCKNYFLWQLNCPDVFQKGGFDVVIGNPPYGVSIKGEYRTQVLNVLGKVPDYEIYYYFLELANKLLHKNGVQSYIIPNTFLFNVFAANYRIKLLETWKVNCILDCTAFKIFESAVVHNAITLFQKGDASELIGYKRTENVNNFETLVRTKTDFISKPDLLSQNQNWGLAFKLDVKTTKILRKIRSQQYLEDFFDVSQGYIPYRRSDLVKNYGKEKGNEIVDKRLWHSDHKISDDYKQEIWGTNLTKYNYSKAPSFIKYGKHLAGYVDLKFFNQPRLLIREITNPAIIGCYVEEELVNDPQIISVIEKTKDYSLMFLWVIINSKLATFYHFNSSPKATKGAFPKILVLDVKRFPIPKATESEKSEIERMARQLLEMKRNDKRADTSDLESKINRLVYRLYDLTPEEIAAIED